MNLFKTTQKGFTIVELLVIVAVIVIIAAIITVSYTGTQNRANDVAVLSDLENFSSLMASNDFITGNPLIWEATPGVPSHEPLNRLGWKASKDAYDTSVDRNVVFCYNYPLIAALHADWGTPRDGRTDWAMVSLSSSGAIFYVSDQQPTPARYTGSTPMVFDSTELICGVVISELGAKGFTSVFHGYRRDDTETGPWRSWTGS